MDAKILIPKIFAEIKKHPHEVGVYEDLYGACMLLGREDPYALENNNRMREMLARNMPKMRGKMDTAFLTYKHSLLFDSINSLDSYLQYLEIERPPQERFYLPRRRRLKVVADAIQDLADDRLDELFLSEPPRVGKTTMLQMAITWLIGKNPEGSNLYSAFSDTITKALYNGVLEVLQDGITYKWLEVFPTASIVQTNAQDETLNINRKKRYPSLTCRSLYGTLNGACDCNSFLIADDLLSGIEEALNKDRLISAWGKVQNNLLTRAKEQAKILWCGTRWSLIDPIGMRLDAVENDENFANKRYKVINLPALNENDESNFVYDYGVGFSSERYHEIRASFERAGDIASWDAQYMGSPIEREGTLFSPDEMRYYNGVLPEKEPDRIFMAVDPAFGGGDSTAAPVCFQYDDDIYVHAVLHDQSERDVTQPALARLVKEYGVRVMQIEANKMTESYKDGVEEELKKKKIKIPITTKPAPTNKAKETRIFEQAPTVRQNFIFRESGKRDKQYSTFMQEMYSFKITGKNKHDDAPDSMAMAASYAFGRREQMRIFKRTF